MGGLAFFNAFPVIISLFLQFAIVVCLRFRFCCNWRKRTKPIVQNIDLKFCLCHGGPKSQKITFGKDPSGPSLIYFNPCIYILHRSPILVMFGVRFVLFCMFLGIQVCFYNPSRYLTKICIFHRLARDRREISWFQQLLIFHLNQSCMLPKFYRILIFAADKTWEVSKNLKTVFFEILKSYG